MPTSILREENPESFCTFVATLDRNDENGRRILLMQGLSNRQSWCPRCISCIVIDTQTREHGLACQGFRSIQNQLDRLSQKVPCSIRTMLNPCANTASTHPGSTPNVMPICVRGCSVYSR